MAILAECPQCHQKQASKNRVCKCGADLVKLKRSSKVKYWISYRLPDGKQRREAVNGEGLNAYSIESAREMHSKRVVQKKENKVFDIKPEIKMTFNELTDWYLGLEKVKATAYFPTLTFNLSSFNAEFGNYIVNQMKPMDLENYQAKKKLSGYSDSYIDQQIGAARGMINKAFDNDIVGGNTLRTFKKVKKLLKRNANARNKILSLEQFNRLMIHLPRHTKAILAMGFFTGMRRGEILSLTWDKVDLKNRVISLDADDTKDKEPRKIPICDELHEILNNIPRAIYDNHLFLYNGKPIKDIRTAFIRGCKDANILYGRNVKDGFIFHDLRHTFNTFMRKAGVAESVIMEITGHSTREMFDRYNTIDEEDARQAVDQFQTYFENVDHSVDQAREAVIHRPPAAPNNRALGGITPQEP